MAVVGFHPTGGPKRLDDGRGGCSRWVSRTSLLGSHGGRRKEIMGGRPTSPGKTSKFWPVITSSSPPPQTPSPACGVQSWSTSRICRGRWELMRETVRVCETKHPNGSCFICRDAAKCVCVCWPPQEWWRRKGMENF